MFTLHELRKCRLTLNFISKGRGGGGVEQKNTPVCPCQDYCFMVAV